MNHFSDLEKDFSEDLEPDLEKFKTNLRNRYHALAVVKSTSHCNQIIRENTECNSLSHALNTASMLMSKKSSVTNHTISNLKFNDLDVSCGWSSEQVQDHVFQAVYRLDSELVDRMEEGESEKCKNQEEEQQQQQAIERNLEQYRIQKKKRSRQKSPYFEYYNALESSMENLEHEFFLQPVAFVIAAFANEENIIEQLTEARSKNGDYLPLVYSSGIIELDVEPIFLIVNVDAGSAEDDVVAAKALNNARSVLGKNSVHLLTIRDKTADSMATKTGYNLFYRFTKDIVLRAANDHLQRRIEFLTEFVERERKGVKNTLKSWFVSTTKEREGLIFENGDESKPPIFLARSLESRIRQLADTYFLIGDFEEALIHYKMANSDYKSLNAELHVASCTEMTALCLIMMDGSKREAGLALDACTEAYATCGYRNLTARSICRLVEYCINSSLTDTAIKALLRAAGSIRQAVNISINDSSKGGDIGVAVFLEKAASIYFYFRNNSRKRKRMLNYFLAGEKYSQLGLHRHALRCFELCRVNLSFRHWSHMHDALNLMIANALFNCGDTATAYALQKSVLEKDTDDSDTFAVSLVSTLRSLKNLDDKSLSLEQNKHVSFPSIDISHLRVYADEFFENPENVLAIEKWNELENLAVREAENLINGNQKDMEPDILRSTAFLPPRGTLALSNLDTPVSVNLNGEFYLHIPIENRLPLILELSDLKIYAVDTKSRSQVGSDIFHVSGTNLNRLQARSKYTLILRVRSIICGTFRMIGLGWTCKCIAHSMQKKILSERYDAPPEIWDLSFQCYHELKLKGKRLNQTREQRRSLVPRYSGNRMLDVDVFPSAAKLSVRFADVTETQIILKEGELKSKSIILTNSGDKYIQDCVLLVGTPKTTCLPILKGRNRSKLPIKVEPNQSFELPMFIRGTRELKSNLDDQEVKILICYSTGVTDSMNSYSTKKMWKVERLNVQITLQGSLAVFPRFLRTKIDSISRYNKFDYLLGIEVEHRDNFDSASYETQRVLVVNDQDMWELFGLNLPQYSILNEENRECVLRHGVYKERLRRNETSTLFVWLKFKKIAETEIGNDPDDAGFDRITSLQLHEQETPLGESYDDNLTNFSTKYFYDIENEKKVLSMLEKGVPAKEIAKVAVLWRIEKEERFGQLYLPPLRPSEWVGTSYKNQPGNNVDKEDFATEQNILVSVVHPTTVEHDFSLHSGLVCVVVHVSIMNTGAQKKAFDVIFNVNEGSIHDTRRGMYWHGDINVKLRCLAPYCSRKLDLKVFLDGPGVYQMNDFDIEISGDKSLIGEVGRVHLEPSYLTLKKISDIEERFDGNRGTNNVSMHDTVAERVPDQSDHNENESTLRSIDL